MTTGSTGHVRVAPLGLRGPHVALALHEHPGGEGAPTWWRGYGPEQAATADIR